jgi:5'-nucleotidase
MLHQGNNCLSSAFAKAVFFSLFIFITSCNKKSYQLEKVDAQLTAVDSTYIAESSIDNFIKPYRKNLEVQMDSTLSYSDKAMNKSDFKFNTPIGNLFAEVVRKQAGPVFLSRTGKAIDIVLLNHGGIRAGLPQGRITMRNAYEIMPFENKIVVAQLNGSQVMELVDYLVEKRRAHPIDGLKIVLNADDTLKTVTVNGAEIKTDQKYYIATNDYLYNGGDDMVFFKDTPQTDVDYKLRSAIIDYFTATDTLSFERDDRFGYESKKTN